MRIRSSALTPFLYKQEFNSDIMKDLQCASDENNIEIMPLLQVLWAMNKTQNASEKIATKGFAEWLQEYDGISLADVAEDIVLELTDGFFRSAPQGQKR